MQNANNIKTANNIRPEKEYFLTRIIGRKAVLNGKKIGSLNDLVIQETDKVPEVTHLIIDRSFGYKSLVIPWEKVTAIEDKAVVLNLESLESYETELQGSEVLLRDHILDKKVLDLDDNEVEVVYDIKLVLRNNHLYASDVDISGYGFLRRLGLKAIAKFISRLAEKIGKETISWTYIQRLPEHISSFRGNVKLNVLKEKLPDIHPVDLADILEELDHKQRLLVFNELDTEHASDTLEEVEPRVQRELISSIKRERAAELINDMTPAQAADILAILPAESADSILALIDRENAQKIQYLLDKHDEKILNFGTSHLIKLPPLTPVSQVLLQYREIARDKDEIMYLYVVDTGNKLLGVVDLKEVLQARVEERMEDIMTTNVITLNPDNTLLEASEMFSRYSFRAIPITDEQDILLGVIPYRDIMNLKHRFV